MFHTEFNDFLYSLYIVQAKAGTTSENSQNMKVVSKLRPPIARNTSDEGNRPSSVAASYHRNEASIMMI